MTFKSLNDAWILPGTCIKMEVINIHSEFCKNMLTTSGFIGRWKSSMGVSMLNKNHASFVFSKSFHLNITIFYLYIETHTPQTGKSFGYTILKNKGSTGAIVQNSLSTVTFLFFIRYLKSFRLIVESREYNLKNMVRGATFWLLKGFL